MPHLKSGAKVMKWQMAMALDLGLRRRWCSRPNWKIVPWAIWVAATKSSSEPVRSSPKTWKLSERRMSRSAQ